MRLHAAANRFNQIECFDAYSDEFCFRAQLALYDDNKRDSETAERRVLSVDPDVEPPARRVVRAGSTYYIIGAAEIDWMYGRPIRKGLVAHEAVELAQVRTLGEICLNQPGFSAWAGRAWVKNMAYTEQSSRLTPQFHINFASTEPVADNHLVHFGNRLLIVRTMNWGPAGALITTCEQLPEPTIEDITVSGSAFDPLTGSMGSSTVAARAVRLRWQSLFQYLSSAAPVFGPEDMQVALAKSVVTAVPGMKLAMSDGSWQVASVVSAGDVWLCRVTRHA
jgi:hypothetical protein